MSEEVERISILFDSTVEMDTVDTDRLVKLASIVLKAESVEWSSIGIVLACHETVRRLNLEYLDHDFETDVLSFLIDRSDDGIEAEIYVDVETAAEQSLDFGATLRQEIDRYVVHGLLHLAGYEDDTPEKKLRMQNLEDNYLTAVD